MTQPGEEQEEVKEVVGREDVGRASRDPEQEGERIYREGHDAPSDDPANDVGGDRLALYFLAAIVLAIVAYVLYLVLS